jgi:hypothetical protein
MTLLCRVVGILHDCIKTASNYDENTASAPAKEHDQYASA